MAMNFDPMTGEPIKKETQENPIKFAGKGKIVAIVLAVVLVIGAGAMVFGGGVFASPAEKVVMAIGNTFEVKGPAGDMISLLNSNKYTLTAEAKVQGISVTGTYMTDGKTKYVGVDAPYVGEAMLKVDSKKVSATAPDILDDVVLEYNFTKDNDGYLIDELEDEGIDQEMLNSLLKTFASDGESEKFAKDLAKSALKVINEWDFENADKEEFEIDGKDVTCTGYEVTVSHGDLEDLLDAIEECLEENNEVLADLYDEIPSLKNTVKNMPKTDITFYIYQNALAAVIVEVNEVEIEVQFLGGETRAQNIVMLQNGEKLLELEGETKKKEREGALIIYQQSYSYDEDGYVRQEIEVMSFSHDEEDGDFEINIHPMLFGESYYASSNYVVEGELLSTRDGITFSLEDAYVPSVNIPVDVTVELKKGCSIPKLEGDVLDIGEASKSDLEDIIEDVQDELRGF